MLRKLVRKICLLVILLGYELILKLKLKKVPLEKLIHNIEKMKIRKISIDYMRGILVREPFALDENSALLVARYFIEPNDQDFLQLDLERTQDWVVLKSVLKKFLNNYKLIDEAEEVALVGSVDMVQLEIFFLNE